MRVDIVSCEECVFWIPPKIETDEGEYLDYPDGYDENGCPKRYVTLEIGVNVQSRCGLYDKYGRNDIHHFMGPHDGCTKGLKKIYD